MMIYAVILAAGPSSRLGRPKQNLVFREKTLLQHAIANAAAVADKVLVVLGSDEESVAATLYSAPVEVLSNPKWPEGMASSIRRAVTHLESEYPDVTHVLFMVCDQPFITAAFLEGLKNMALTTGAGIVAAEYGDTMGVPAIFKVTYYPELKKLAGDEGAKHVLTANLRDLKCVPLQQAAIDIDTEENYKDLLANEQELNGY